MVLPLSCLSSAPACIASSPVQMKHLFLPVSFRLGYPFPLSYGCSLGALDVTLSFLAAFTPPNNILQQY